MSVASSQSPRLMESLCDLSRRSEILGKGTSDDRSMSWLFAQQMYRKALCMSTLCTVCEEEPSRETDDDDFLDSDMTDFYGQAGYISAGPAGVDSDCEESVMVPTWCVTAKHNLSIHSRPDENANVRWLLPDEPHKIVSVDKSHKMRFVPGDFRCKKSTTTGTNNAFGFGIDITFSIRKVDRLRFSVFELVREGFQYKVGLKIGIAVCRDFSVAPDKAGKSVTQAQFDTAFGTEQLAIYTGEIIALEEHFFRHSINTYQGCSGAITFLLEGQENPFDDGKAIGVHTNSNMRGDNFAFKLLPSLLPQN